jgi:hypothetical protein
MVFWKRSTPKVETTPQRPVRSAATPAAAPVVENKLVDKSKLNLQDSKASEAAAPKTSFDPYNSGAFDRKDTWGKVIRK